MIKVARIWGFNGLAAAACAKREQLAFTSSHRSRHADCCLGGQTNSEVSKMFYESSESVNGFGFEEERHFEFSFENVYHSIAVVSQDCSRLHQSENSSEF